MLATRPQQEKQKTKQQKHASQSRINEHATSNITNDGEITTN